MLSADLALAQRLERQEALGGARFVEARQRFSPGCGAEWIEIGGVHAMFDGATSPVTQTFGLGLFSETTATDLVRLEAFFRERNSPVIHEVSPLSGAAVFEILCRRGYRPVELTSVMYRPLQPTLTPGSLSREAMPIEARPMQARPMQARRIREGEEELWSQVSARGWSQSPEFTEFLLGFGRVMASVEGSLAFFACLNGQPVATGALRCQEGVALLAGASTIPGARKQGAQQALFEIRMKAALDQGCDLAMMCAEPGSSSQRNAERQGFRIAYTRVKWRLEP